MLGWRFGTEEEPLITAVENSWDAMELLFCLNTQNGLLRVNIAREKESDRQIARDSQTDRESKR